MPEVYRRKGRDGKLLPFWYYDISVNGRRLRVSTKRTKKPEAQEVCNQRFKELLNREQLGALEELTIYEAVCRYVQSVQRNADYRNIVSRARKLLGRRLPDDAEDVEIMDVYHVNPDMMWHDLTTREVEKLRAKRAGEGNSEATVNHEVAILSATYHLLEEEVRCRPGVKFPLYKLREVARYFTEEEIAQLLADLNPQRPIVGREGKMAGKVIEISRVAKQQRQDAYDLAVFLLDTGCRYGEVQMIGWDSIDTIHWKWVNIYRSKVGNEGNLMMTERLREVLKRRWAERRNGHYVFTGYGEGGGPRAQSTASIRRAINRLGFNNGAKVQRFGRRDVRSFRDTFATRLRKAGMSLDRIQKLLGHSSPRMTQKYAGLAVSDASQEAAAVLDRLAAG